MSSTQHRARIRVFLVEDHAMLSDATVHALRLQDDLEVLGSAPDMEAAQDRLRALRPSVVLVDHRLPGMSGLDGVRWIGAELPEARCILLTAYGSPELIRNARRAGVRGFLHKGKNRISELVDAIRDVAAGRERFDATAPELPSPLTNAEENVLRALVRTHGSDKDLALRLGVERSTIATHIRSLLLKAGAKNRGELAHWGHERGFF